MDSWSVATYEIDRDFVGPSTERDPSLRARGSLSKGVACCCEGATGSEGAALREGAVLQDPEEKGFQC